MVGVGVPLLLAVLLLFVAPAAAHHKDGHDKGPKSSKKVGSSGVADEGDNKHPSGKDRSVEKGGSGTQGNSGSDPDDDGRGPDRSNGGADKPGGPGGDDLADQDGNNGCGNDDDFEDDNEGWCGRKPKSDDAKPSAKASKGKPEAGDGVEGDKVEDEVVQDDDSVPTVPCAEDAKMVDGGCVAISDVISKDDDAEVLGERVTRDDSEPAVDADPLVSGIAASDGDAERSPSVLPLTGSGIVKLLVVAAVFVVLGFILLKARRRI
jgi:hypothetical protein